MGRGVSYGGGQSSLGYLFGSGEAPKSATGNAPVVQNEGKAINKEPASKPSVSATVDATNQIPAGIQSTASRNHFGGDGQNTGNFITISLVELRTSEKLCGFTHEAMIPCFIFLHALSDESNGF